MNLIVAKILVHVSLVQIMRPEKIEEQKSLKYKHIYLNPCH